MPCGCEMLAVVAVELMKVGMCSKCGHRFPPAMFAPGGPTTAPAAAADAGAELASNMDRDMVFDPHSNDDNNSNVANDLDCSLSVEVLGIQSTLVCC